MSHQNMQAFWDIIINQANGMNNHIKYLIESMKLHLKLKKIKAQFLKNLKNFLDEIRYFKY
tara:strand:- start:264 stop:446 length:183 start_codon:yes stop_codon:yes gene_type:complete